MVATLTRRMLCTARLSYRTFSSGMLHVACTLLGCRYVQFSGCGVDFSTALQIRGPAHSHQFSLAGVCSMSVQWPFKRVSTRNPRSLCQCSIPAALSQLLNIGLLISALYTSPCSIRELSYSREHSPTLASFYSTAGHFGEVPYRTTQHRTAPRRAVCPRVYTDVCRMRVSSAGMPSTRSCVTVSAASSLMPYARAF